MIRNEREACVVHRTEAKHMRKRDRIPETATENSPDPFLTPFRSYCNFHHFAP